MKSLRLPSKNCWQVNYQGNKMRQNHRGVLGSFIVENQRVNRRLKAGGR